MAVAEAGLRGLAWKVGGDPTQAKFTPFTEALPLAIRMEGNTVDRSKVALDSSKLFFKGQMEEPGGEKGERRDPINSFSISFQNPSKVAFPKMQTI